MSGGRETTFARRGLPGAGPEGGKVAFILPTPNWEDAYAKRILSGANGSFFNWALAQAGLLRHQVWITSWVSTPMSNAEFFASRHAHEDELTGELAMLRAMGYTVFVPLGPAKDFFGLSGGLDKVRGSISEYNGAYVLPTYEPYQVHGTGRENRSGDKANMKYVWIADLAKAREISENGYTLPKENFEIFPDLNRVRRWFAEAKDRGQDLLAVDIETTGFNTDYAEEVVIGFARSPEDALVVPLLSRGGQPYWQNGQRKEIKDLLNSVFAEFSFVFQNALFDVPFLRGRGYDLSWSRVKHDTMLLHHALHPELPHSLGFIVSVYGATPYWKEEFLGKKGSILDMDDEDLRTYNARDCVVLHQVLRPMLEDLGELGLEKPYAENLALLAPISHMMESGVTVDMKYLGRWAKAKAKEVELLEGELRKLAGLPDAFNFRSTDDKRWFFYGIEPPKFAKLAELAEYEVEGSRKKKGTKKYEALLELKAVRDLVRPIYLPPGFEAPTTANDLASLDGQALLSLQVHTQNRIESRLRLKDPPTEEIALARKLLTFLGLYDQWNTGQKLLTFPKAYKPKADGKLHPRFLIHGTSTGRLSCAEPNLQQVPKKELAIRKGFVAGPGKVFVSADYENLEVHVLAYETGDAELIRMIQGGINIHDENTKVLFGIDEGHPQWKLARTGAKIFMFGGIAYGGGDRGIYEKVILAAPELGLTFHAFQQAKARWMEKHKGYQLWADDVVERALRTRKVKTFLGRTRILTGKDHEVRRQALNTPIQGGAGGILNTALISLHKEISETKDLGTRMVLTIHDQIILEAPNEELEIAAKLLQKHMEQPFDFYGTERRFVAEVEFGPSLGDLRAYIGNAD